MKIETCEITVKMDLKNIILELREVAQELNEFADKLVMIEIKYNKEQTDNGNDD
jgi:hypothetical protein